MSKKHVTVLRGGISSEREVSLASGSNIIEALKETGYQVSDLVANDDLEQIIQCLKEQKPDIVFNALHGRFGEDGAIQGVLEWMNIPYTHGGICSSAIAMNKQMTRILLADSGLPVATGKVIPVHELAHQDPLPSPYVIKPIEEGSSVGVYIVNETDAQERKKRRQKIIKEWHFGDNVLVEQFIPGKELTVCVMRDKALTITDISSGTHVFYDYTSKYTAGESKHILPAQIHPKAFQKAIDYAQQAHKILGCYPVSRTDFRYDNSQETSDHPGALYILEVNTQPGMTKTSLLPEQAQYCGISYPDLCSWLVEHAKCRA
ncbi:D-alanine--D-alanine ligase [Commensalibacter papalotli (ex Botero et al. 2024)]|uniref:D-alanine--D-alanine ligase n=1 Tax=Commensalibacter papalotli (ex Botero et al. 2024) TaxID=2972766 RepID=A0ABM9HMG2_9PROT|nr:D-alanine--D-alanine ligase [Commensalibacter papalotli (ex Botero et al. 2024)]CAI3936068.1 D-alanine-D-alanine ligase or related ATP-grasp enzyme (DdlA) (PDB:1E4E) [Commensalibacter papalotli (ex Botero et al. 2024)]CAI3939549.1 D-alanine-D-alanine ligase or related ATP-grasp enzyme (DdlA) (PDB:1E4E) [Commensalibacter papalotli (ex Botero et al. 2024)]